MCASKNALIVGILVLVALLFRRGKYHKRMKEKERENERVRKKMRG
jgi:hypothetical protein